MTNQLAFSLFDYFNFQKNELLVSDEQTAYQKHDKLQLGGSGAGRKTYVYDCGEELKGARKHLSMTRFSVEWQKAIEEDPSQAFQLVCKDELLDGFKPDMLREEGFTSQAAFAVKLIWDRVDQRPQDDPKQREYFIQAVEELRLRLSGAKTEELIRKVIDELREDYVKGIFSHNPRKLSTEPELINFRFWLSLGTKYRSLHLSSRRSLPGYHSILKKAFSAETGMDWNWIKGKKRDASARNNEASERWVRLVPEEVIRLSQEPSGVSRPDDLLEQYSFRGVQFGNWVQDVAGKYHVLCSGNALADLSMILDLPRKAVSLYGMIGLAFGARGSGSAVAHYEPSTNVINLTKIRGGGALCHEWAHALDFNLYSYSHKNLNGKRVALSGNKPGEHLPNEVSSAFTKLMKEIKKGSGTIKVTVPNPLTLGVKNYRAGVVTYLKRSNYNINAALIALKGSNYKIGPKQWKDIGMFFCNVLAKEEKQVPTEFFIPTDESSFYLDAKERGAYWKRDHELFARAFEAWIEDELHERGMVNSYLVSGTTYGGPYPQGSERISINKAFRNWWEVLTNSGILHNDQLWN